MYACEGPPFPWLVSRCARRTEFPPPSLARLSRVLGRPLFPGSCLKSSQRTRRQGTEKAVGPRSVALKPRALEIGREKQRESSGPGLESSSWDQG